jgi:hypothetical protein
MQAVAIDWSGNGVGIEHGPLVYALPVKEQWTPVVAPKWSTAEFPQWNATPANAWNYALALNEIRDRFPLKVERKSMTSDPFVDPPVTVTVPVRKVVGWELRADSAHPERLQTPPLAVIDEAHSLANAEIEWATLVPYGATQLRLTIFPKITAAYE